MRRLPLLLPAFALLLAGCDGMRQAAAAHRKVAEEGIPFLSVNAGQAEAAAAADPAAVPSASGPPLPTSLGGDKENAVYTPAPAAPPPR